MITNPASGQALMIISLSVVALCAITALMSAYKKKLGNNYPVLYFEGEDFEEIY